MQKCHYYINIYIVTCIYINNIYIHIYIHMYEYVYLFYIGLYLIPECMQKCHYSVGYGFGIPFNLMNIYFVYMIFKKLFKEIKADKKN
jgi:hypothetical protein